VPTVSELIKKADLPAISLTANVTPEKK
jgi:hypothetical protein